VKHPERAEDYLEHIVEAIDRVTEYLRIFMISLASSGMRALGTPLFGIL
jgi:hypothetical protein